MRITMVLIALTFRQMALVIVLVLVGSLSSSSLGVGFGGCRMSWSCFSSCWVLSSSCAILSLRWLRAACIGLPSGVGEVKESRILSMGLDFLRAWRSVDSDYSAS